MALTCHSHFSPGNIRSIGSSVEQFSIDEHGALNLSWIFPTDRSTGVISLEPSSKIWSRLHPSCVATSIEMLAPRACNSSPHSPHPPKPLIRTRSGSKPSKFPHFRFLDLSKEIRLIIYDIFTCAVGCFPLSVVKDQALNQTTRFTTQYFVQTWESGIWIVLRQPNSSSHVDSSRTRPALALLLADCWEK